MKEQSIQKTGRISSRLLLILRIALCGALALFTSFAGQCFLHPREKLYWALIYIPAWLIFYLLASEGVLRLYPLLSADPWGDRLRPFYRMNRHNLLRLAALFAAVYLLWLLVYYPGVCGSDTCNQIKDLITGTSPLPYEWHHGQPEVAALMNDHHPVLTTLVFTFFYEIGALTGHYNLGMFLYCGVQIVCMSLLFACTLCALTELGMPSVLALGGTVFYCMPFIAHFAICMLKDSLFSVVFTAWFLTGVLLRTQAGTEGQEPRPGRWALFLALSVLAALTNKKGMYLTFASGIFMIPVFRSFKDRFKALLSAVLPAAVIILLLGRVLFPLFQIYPGGRQEAIAFTFQQTAYTYIQHPESFTEEDKEILNGVLTVPPESYADLYSNHLTDSIKSQYRFHATDEDVAAYLKLWLSKFLSHPLDYARATFMVNGGYFAPGKGMVIYTEPRYYSSIKAFSQPARTEKLRSAFTGAFERFCAFPLTALLFDNVLYFWWTPLAVLMLLVRQRKFRQLSSLVPIAANILFLILGPICWTRYGLCQLYTVPIVWALPFLGTPAADGSEEVLLPSN